MTTTDATDLARLLAALDDGDDSMLPIVADLLEEAGDQRAVGLRRVAGWHAYTGFQPHLREAPVAGEPRIWGWIPNLPGNEKYAYGLLKPAVFSRLRDNVWPGIPEGRYYPTRSAAYLALAAALTPSQEPTPCPI